MSSKRNKADSQLFPDNALFAASPTNEETTQLFNGEYDTSIDEQSEVDQSPEIVVTVDNPLAAPVGIRANVTPANLSRLEGFEKAHGVSRSEALDLLLEMIDEMSPSKIYDLKEKSLLAQLAALKAKYQN